MSSPFSGKNWQYFDDTTMIFLKSQLPDLTPRQPGRFSKKSTQTTFRIPDVILSQNRGGGGVKSHAFVPLKVHRHEIKFLKSSLLLDRLCLFHV